MVHNDGIVHSTKAVGLIEINGNNEMHTKLIAYNVDTCNVYFWINRITKTTHLNDHNSPMFKENN